MRGIKRPPVIIVFFSTNLVLGNSENLKRKIDKILLNLVDFGLSERT